MASAPKDGGAVLGRVDRSGRLVSADEPLADLQHQAGGEVGDLLVLPQLATIARLALTLKVPIERPVAAASGSDDLELWVRAMPQGEEVLLEIEGWTARAAAPPRFGVLSGAPAAAASAATKADYHWSSDAQLKLTDVGNELAAALKLDAAKVAGQPLTKLVKLIEDEDGDMPLLNAVALRQSFEGQRAQSRGRPPIELTISGTVSLDAGGQFEGFSGRFDFPNGAPAASEAIAAGGERAVSAPSLEPVLRAPLEKIIDNAERIAARADGPLRSDYASYGNDIAAAARHLSQVVGTIGREQRSAAGQIDLASLAAEATMLVEPAADDRGVRIEIDEVGALPAIGEEHAVIQILVNLVGNAVRHSPTGESVHLSFARDDRTVAVGVHDRGPGIPLADQQRIFERFERVDQQSGGTGLGLAISRRLARSMGGEVELVSVPGDGSTFTLILPGQPT